LTLEPTTALAASLSRGLKLVAVTISIPTCSRSCTWRELAPFISSYWYWFFPWSAPDRPTLMARLHRLVFPCAYCCFWTASSLIPVWKMEIRPFGWRQGVYRNFVAAQCGRDSHLYPHARTRISLQV